ncbi:MAG TPA: adenylate/guanylate cyclase domain-containing protein [Rudaea sp.]|nr:adenylate/guanylate cyclase domain-containing protein [Rudaea sp.]
MLVTRKLAAIMVLDVVGYSRLMGSDESGTLSRLMALRHDLLDPGITRCEGRIVKTLGDGLLVEFSSAVSAVLCAAEIQQALKQHVVNGDVPLTLRIGINLGDVIVQDDDIYGDGVNVAARLEGIAEPGGICISREVASQVRDRLPYRLEDRGAVQLKNIDSPVQVFRVVLDPDAAPIAPVPAASVLPRSRLERTRIAVLPFDNMSGEAADEYFADGISEDIITELSRFHSLFVIARHSTFVYKGKQVGVAEVGRELGVSYVLEGSVRRSGQRLRITAQLIEVATGNHLWAERYDRALDDVFMVQDEITRRIVAMLPARMEAAELEHARRKPAANLGAYDFLLRAKYLHHRGSAEENAEALRCLQQALELDAENAQIHAWIACTYGQAFIRGYLPVADAQARLREAAMRAAAVNAADSDSQRILCEIALIDCDLERAVGHHEQAFSINPNDPIIVAQRCDIRLLQGLAEEALDWGQQVLALDPSCQLRWHYLGMTYYALGRYNDAVAAFRRHPSLRAAQVGNFAACHARLGDGARAAELASEVMRSAPSYRVGDYLRTRPYVREVDLEHHRAGLLAAGLPA